MENISLAIVTDDREYGRALGLAILNTSNSFIITVSAKNEFIRCGKRTDLILWDGEEAREAYGGNIILISEKPSMTMVDLSNNRYSLYKYGSAEALVGSLLEIYSRLTGRNPVSIRKHDIKLFAFTSWAGGSGCTTVAMAAGQELCRFRGKRVLYLSFESIESTGEFINGGGGMKSLNQYMYELFSREKKGNFLQSYLIKDDFGMEAFAPSRGRNPLLDMSKDEAYLFIASIIDSGRFDVIIADAATCLSDVGMVCVEMADKICMVAPPAHNQAREIQYLSHMIYNCGEHILQKMIKVKNMTESFAAEEKEQEMKECEGEANVIETCLYIEDRLPYLEHDSIKKLLLEGDFGKRINLLTDKLLQA